MSLTPLSFVGISKFSEDFQSILNRAVQIAALPAKQLQNQQSDLLQQKVLVSNLSDTVGTLASRVKSLGAIGANKALAATSSNSSIVTASSTGATAPASYTITNITSVAKAAAEASAIGYADGTSTPVSSTGTVKLVAGSHEYTIDLTGKNNLAGLRDAINNLGAGVTASVLTTGTGTDPYYLSVTANLTGATTLEIRDDPDGANTNLLTSNNQGANTEFEFNGVPVSKTSTFINDVVPGLTFSILDTTDPGEQVNVTISSNRSQLSSSLQNFVTAYNSVRDGLNAQIGENAGLLSGDYLVRETLTRIRSLVSYRGTGSGSIQSLGELGVEFDANGTASFNSDTFNALSTSAIQDAFDFLGSENSGFGDLSKSLTAISDPISGLAKIQIDRYDATDDRLTAQIAQLTDRVANLQLSVNAKLQAADALLASLDSQQTILDATLKSVTAGLFGKDN